MKRMKLGYFLTGFGHHVASSRHPDALAHGGMNLTKTIEQAKLLEQAKAVATGENQSTAAQINATYQIYNMRRNEALFLESTVLKSANQAMDFVMRSFRLGRLNYLEVIEAQRTLFETKLQYLEATSAAQIALIELEKLTKLEFHIN